MKVLQLVLVGLLVVSVLGLPHDKSELLESVVVQFQNGLQDYTLSDFSFVETYGNLESSPASSVSIQYQEQIMLNYTTACGQGCVYDSDQKVVSNSSVTVYADPIEIIVSFARKSNFTFIQKRLDDVYPDISLLITIIPSLTMDDEESSQHETEAILSLAEAKGDFPPPSIQYNLTICNNFDHKRKAYLLGGTTYWGVPSQLPPPELHQGDCGSAIIFPLCSGGEVGANITYISYGEKFNMYIGLSPESGHINYGRNVNCIHTGQYSEGPNSYCELVSQL